MRIVSYDPETIPEGERIIVIDGDNPLRFDSLSELKAPIIQNANDITRLDSEFQALKNNENTNETQIVDNTRRINNLEDRTLDSELMYALDLASVKYTFVNETNIEITHNRKEIYIKKVMAYAGTVGNEENYEDITSQVVLKEKLIKDNEGKIISKKLIIESNDPITGYIIFL